MLPNISRLASRRWALLAGALVAGGALFGAGVLTARAFDDGGGSTPAASPNGSGAPGQGLPLPANEGTVNAGGTSKDAPASGGRGADSALYAPGACSGVLGDVVHGSAIDLSAEGMTPSLLGEGFALRSLTLRSEAPCDATQPAKGNPVLDSQWFHGATGYDVTVSQRKGGDPVANVINGSSATFMANGYAFAVYVTQIYYAVDDKGIESGSGGSSAEPARPAIAPGGVDEKAVALLKDVIARLAPGLGEQCFYRPAAQGSWSDLAAIGIGDPRPAIPSRFVEESLNVRTFVAPEAGCNSAPLAKGMTGFDAQFVETDSNGSVKGVAFLAAYELPEGSETGAGYIDAYSAYWANGRYQFNIGLKSDQPAGVDTIRAIALALDPSFASACLSQNRTLEESELAGLGLPKPRLPDGYSFSATSLQATQVSGNCSGSAGKGVEQYNLSWTMTNGGDVIEAGLTRYPAGVPLDGNKGFIAENTVVWNDGKNTVYHVNAYSKGISATVSRETLVEVAKSLDPSLDVNSLVQGEGGGQSVPVPPDAKPR